MELVISEVWNELVRYVRPIGAALSSEEGRSLLSNPQRVSSFNELISEIRGFESILDGLKSDGESFAALLLAANSIASKTRGFAAREKDSQRSSEVPLFFRGLAMRADELVTSVFRFARKLPDDVLERYMPGWHVSREDDGREVEDKLDRLFQRQTAVQSRQIELDRSISELGERVEQKFGQFELQAETAFTAMRSSFDDEGKKLLDSYAAAKGDLATRLKAMDQLFGVLASKALGGGYMRNALKEERLADGFRNTAVVMMVALGLYLVGAIASMEIKAINPEQAVVRGTGVLFFSFVIGYLIRQSAVHRAQQHRYQRTALDLKAIDPFLADLPPEARHAVKLQLADKIFVPKDVLAASDSAGFGWAELAMKAMDKAKSAREKSS